MQELKAINKKVGELRLEVIIILLGALIDLLIPNSLGDLKYLLGFCIGMAVTLVKTL